MVVGYFLSSAVMLILLSSLLWLVALCKEVSVFSRKYSRVLLNYSLAGILIGIGAGIGIGLLENPFFQPLIKCGGSEPEIYVPLIGQVKKGFFTCSSLRALVLPVLYLPFLTSIVVVDKIRLNVHTLSYLREDEIPSKVFSSLKEQLFSFFILFFGIGFAVGETYSLFPKETIRTFIALIVFSALILAGVLIVYLLSYLDNVFPKRNTEERNNIEKKRVKNPWLT